MLFLGCLNRTNVQNFLVRRVCNSLVGKRNGSEDDQQNPHERRAFHNSSLDFSSGLIFLSGLQARRSNPPSSETRNRITRIWNINLAILTAVLRLHRKPTNAASS